MNPYEMRCTTHGAAQAGWSCQACGRALCPECAVRRKAGASFLDVCLHCGGFAKVLLVPKARATFAALLPRALNYPFSRNGLLVMLASGFVFALLSYTGPIGWVLSTSAWASYLFLVIRTTALGEDDVPESEDFRNVFDLIGSLAKFFVAFLLSVVPFILYVWKLKPAFTGSTGAAYAAHWLLDPFVYLTLIAGIAWVPMALVLAATHTPFATVVNPVAAVAFIRRLGFDYVLAAVAFWVFVGVDAVLDGFGTMFVEGVGVPYLPRVLAQAVGTYGPLGWAHVLGLLLRVRGADIGYGRDEDHYEPALGALQPREQTAVEAVAAVAVAGATPGVEVSQDLAASLRATSPVDLTLDLANAGLTTLPEGGAAPFAGLPPRRKAAATDDLVSEEQFAAENAVPRAASPAPPPAPARPAVLVGGRVAAPVPAMAPETAALVRDGRWDLLAQAYRAQRGRIAGLGASQLVQVAQAAEDARDFQSAAHAYNRAGLEHASDPGAPDALFHAARLLREGLGKAAEAAKVLDHLVRTYPSSKAAALARAQQEKAS